jgi:IS5 family transposase
MLRVYFLQQWFDLSDPKSEDVLYDSESMRSFAPVKLGDDAVPDESTILRFRHLLERQQLAPRSCEIVRTLLETQKLLLKDGTSVDARIIAAPRAAIMHDGPDAPGDRIAPSTTIHRDTIAPHGETTHEGATRDSRRRCSLPGAATRVPADGQSDRVDQGTWVPPRIHGTHCGEHCQPEADVRSRFPAN